MFDEIDIFHRGMEFLEKDDPDRAIEAFDEAIEINPKYLEAYYSRGNAYEAKGQFELAIRSFNEVLHFAPNEPAAYYNRG
ncbi:MAG: tetratricopeptide repeat protein, partial [Candidatus Nealsonbacteria bacterium]|nr:tetratricopeptide repeat protein [Candidatus Nealsonbacteria bacterium]